MHRTASRNTEFSNPILIVMRLRNLHVEDLLFAKDNTLIKVTLLIFRDMDTKSDEPL